MSFDEKNSLRKQTEQNLTEVGWEFECEVRLAPGRIRITGEPPPPIGKCRSPPVTIHPRDKQCCLWQSVDMPTGRLEDFRTGLDVALKSFPGKLQRYQLFRNQRDLLNSFMV